MVIPLNKITVNDIEYSILYELRSSYEPIDAQFLSKKLGIPISTLMSTLEALKERGLITINVQELYIYKLTQEGILYSEKGLPERQIYNAIISLGGSATMEQLLNTVALPKNLIELGIGHARKLGWITLKQESDKFVLKALPQIVESNLEQLIQKLSRGPLTVRPIEDITFQELVRRKLAERKVIKTYKISLTDTGKQLLDQGLIILSTEKSTLTSDDILSGRWTTLSLKSYNVKALPPIIYPGRKHPYISFLEEVRKILLEMGFSEAEGFFVEQEFWNFDVLFQAQDHPAREIHDSYRVKQPSLGTLEDSELVEKVRNTHESGWITGSRGWRYKWSAEIARRLILRTQTTSVSVRYLYKHKNPPIKMFALSRVFRPDVLDPTHSMEFHQCEGIVMDKNLTFRDLLGFLKEFSNRLGITKIKFKPSYFPFTEPSVEGYIYHEKLGWIEALPGGMFRPEVLAPLDIKYPVLAWGIGIDRLAMAVLGINDIRELFTRDLSYLRNFPWLRSHANY